MEKGLYACIYISVVAMVKNVFFKPQKALLSRDIV